LPPTNSDAYDGRTTLITATNKWGPRYTFDLHGEGGRGDVAGGGAQQPVIGFLSFQSAEVDFKNVTVPFLQGLKETGYAAGQNVAVEYRYAENQFDRLSVLAADLVRRPVVVMVATGNEAALAAKAATRAIPIVFAVGGDPVALRLVASINRPGAADGPQRGARQQPSRNLTGVA
jgi:ABC transporter substrate binding protein